MAPYTAQMAFESVPDSRREEDPASYSQCLLFPPFGEKFCEMWSSVKYEVWDVLCKALKLNDIRTSSTTQVARASSRTKAPLNI